MNLATGFLLGDGQIIRKGARGRGYKVQEYFKKCGHREMRSQNARTVQYDGVGEGGLKINERQKSSYVVRFSLAPLFPDPQK